LLSSPDGTLLQEFEGHTDLIRVLVFSPDGRFLVSGSMDGAVVVWSVDGSAPPTSLEGHEAHVTSAAFSADGRLIVSAAGDGTVRVWDRSGTSLACLAPPDIGECGRITSGSEGQQISEMIFYGALAVAFTPDGQSVVTLSEGDLLRWWDWRTGTCRRTVLGAGDFRAIVDERPWRALVRGIEVVIESSDGIEVGWLICAPDSLFHRGAPGLHLTTHPNGRIWAGASGQHLYHFVLEGE
jgi:WD40 repeat protein